MDEWRNFRNSLRKFRRLQLEIPFACMLPNTKFEDGSVQVLYCGLHGKEKEEGLRILFRVKRGGRLNPSDGNNADVIHLVHILNC